jgi:hypothetical protein
MLNPLRSEAEAYRFLLLTVGAFAVIVAAHEILGGTAAWITFGLIVLAATAMYVRARSGDRLEQVRPRQSAANERRILVVANETVGGEALRQAIEERAAEVEEHVLVVCPALNTRLRHWASDDDAARASAQERLERSLRRLAEAGVEARGEVGDSEPLQAMEDALRTFGPDEIIISTHPEGRSNWLERGVVARARERFAVPITHVVVDLQAEELDETGT